MTSKNYSDVKITRYASTFIICFELITQPIFSCLPVFMWDLQFMILVRDFAAKITSTWKICFDLNPKVIDFTSIKILIV